MCRLLKTVLRETLPAASPGSICCFTCRPVQLTVACRGCWDFLRTGPYIYICLGWVGSSIDLKDSVWLLTNSIKLGSQANSGVE